MRGLDKKAVLTLVLGYFSLFLTKFAIPIDQAYDLYFMPGLIIPIFVAILYGWKYAIYCCVFGLSMLQPFFIVKSNGWGNMVTAFAILIWAVGHGICKELVLKKKTPFAIQYLYQCIFVLLFLLLNKPLVQLLVKQNTKFPYYYAYSYLPENIINANATILLEFMTIWMLVMNSVVMLPCVQKLRKEKVEVYDYYSYYVLGITLIIGVITGMFTNGSDTENQLLCITFAINDYQSSVGSIQFVLLKEAFILFLGDISLHFIHYYCEGQYYQLEMAKIQDAVFESSQDMIWSISGIDGKILTANHIARNFFVQRYTEYATASFLEIFDKEEVDFWEDSLEKTKESKNYQTEFYDKKKKKFFELQMHRIELTGNQYDIAFFAKDVTDEVMLNEKLKETNDELENRVLERTKEIQKKNDELESFTYTIAHELKAPIRAIDLYNQIIIESENGKLSAEAKDAVDKISLYCKKTLKLISEMLNYSKMKTKKLKLVRIQMDYLFDSVIEEIRLLNNEQKIEVEKETLPEVMADEMLLRCCIYNIISNAVKYSSKQNITKIKILYEGHEKEHIFHIKDNGVGFDMKAKGKLFQLFGRMHSDSEYEGNGIGLVTVKNIIEKHGGNLSIQAVESKGCEVIFSLPK